MRQKKEHRPPRVDSARLDELETHYLEQLPTIAALLAQEQDDPDDYESAAERAVDLVDAVLTTLEGDEAE